MVPLFVHVPEKVILFDPLMVTAPVPQRTLLAMALAPTRSVEAWNKVVPAEDANLNSPLPRAFLWPTMTLPLAARLMVVPPV